MQGVQDRLGDLSWLGITDRAWFEITEKELVDQQVERNLKETEPMVASDNVNMTKQQRSDWIEYRRLLSEVHLQVGYPKEIYWPTRPE